MVSVPVRVDVVPFAAMVNDGLPFPGPSVPAVPVIRAVWPTAVPAEPAGAVTATVPVSPLDATDCDTGAIENVHGPPVSVTVNVLPPIVTVPLRDVVPVFAATLSDTVPGPDPLVPVAIVIHA